MHSLQCTIIVQRSGFHHDISIHPCFHHIYPITIFLIPSYSLPSSLFVRTYHLTFMPFFPPMHARKPVIFAFVLAFLTIHDNLQFYTFPTNSTEPGACYLASVRQLSGQQDPGSTSSPLTNTRLKDPDVCVYFGTPHPGTYAFTSPATPSLASLKIK